MVRAFSAVGFACVVGLVEQGLALPHDHHDARGIYNAVGPKQSNAPALPSGIRDKRANCKYYNSGNQYYTSGVRDIEPFGPETTPPSWTVISGVVDVIDVPVTGSQPALVKTSTSSVATPTSKPVSARAISESPSEPSPSLPEEIALRHYHIQGTGGPHPSHSWHGFHHTHKSGTKPVPTGHVHGKSHKPAEPRAESESPSEPSPTMPEEIALRGHHIQGTGGPRPTHSSHGFHHTREPGSKPVPTGHGHGHGHGKPHEPAEPREEPEQPSDPSPTLPEDTQNTAGPHPTGSSPEFRRKKVNRPRPTAVGPALKFIIPDPIEPREESEEVANL